MSDAGVGSARAADRVRPPAPAVELRGITKTFGGEQALRSASLRIEPGEVHGVLGENGSGKSTLIKVLAGYHVPDAGELFVRGTPISLPLRAGQARTLGIEFVHQDLGLVPSLTVVENLRIGDLAANESPWFISWRTERRRARKLFNRYGMDLDPAATVATVDPIQRAMLAIVRAVEALKRTLGSGAGATGLLVLDEPTVFLPRTGVQEVFRLIREVVSEGASVLFVSHDLDEVRQVTDRITVLRDGVDVGTVATSDTDESELVQLILGRALNAATGDGRAHAARQGPCLSLSGAASERVGPLDLDVAHGELVGLTGLIGSGFEELPYIIFGATPGASGQMVLDGASHDLAGMSPAVAIRAGMALVPADRQSDASVPSLATADNISLQWLGRYFRGGRLRRRQVVHRAAELTEEFDVRPRDPRRQYWTLSGGNQQKAVLAKWLSTGPRVLLLHEPTQGVDIGSRQQIFRFITRAAADGMAVVCASSDYAQLAAICDRVLVLRRGNLVSELRRPLTKELIAEECYRSIAPRPTIG
jgi:ribose transport system ATP-binding protein